VSTTERHSLLISDRFWRTDSLPLYVYRCRSCESHTEVFQHTFGAPSDAVCERCGSLNLARVYTPFTTQRSELDKLQNLDSKYYDRVDRAMANTRDADPMRHLERMTPFSAATDPGNPITF
jgi:putative FmdB family regulatory protein